MKKVHRDPIQLTSKPFYFLRHGETEWNKMRRYQGRTDIPLNEAGLNQAHEVKPFLKDESISHIFSSQLLRAKKTAEVVNQELGVLHLIKENLQECCFGDLEGNDVTSESRQIVDQWAEGNTPTGAEPYQDFANRIINAVNECMSEALTGIPLIVSHGGAFTTLAKPMGYQTPVYIKNCELVLCEPPTRGNLWRLISLSEHG